MKKILLVAVLLLTFAPAAIAQNGEVKAVAQGLTIQLDPGPLMKERGRGVKGAFPSGGCGYKVEWGDGLSDPKPYFPADVHCKSSFWHAYERPGVYLIRLSLPATVDGKTVWREAGRTQIWVQ